MIRKGRLPELLAPAGDFEALLAAVEAGADAVYVGGKCFSARAFAKNFELEELERAVIYCHLHGVKLYVTINTLIYDKELSLALTYAAELWRIGVDAVICADVGLISLIKRHIPELELHASTQMSVHNSFGADEAARLGCERVVLARELSLGDIKGVTEKCLIGTEIFLHGALCVCHSGQCLFSAMVGGRSGNRGECAQPCRLPYGDGYPLSLKDLSLASRIPALIESGVESLKIEGRMKSPEYVYRVTKIYRRLLDEGRAANQEELSELEAVFSRGGFTDGYFVGNYSSMTGVRSQSDKESTERLEERSFSPIRVPVRAYLRAVRGEPASLELIMKDRRALVEGPIPSEAITAPLTREGVAQRLMKMGESFFSLSNEDIALVLDEGVNLSPGAINELRREAISALCSSEREGVNIEYTLPERRRARAMTTVEALTPDALFALLKADRAATDLTVAPLEILCELDKKYDKIAAALPPIIMESELNEVEQMLVKAKNIGIKYAFVGNIGHFALAKRCGLKIIGNARLNVINRESAEVYRALGCEELILSHELSLPQARDVGGGVTVYGRLPLMITERCFIKENFGCESCSNARLKDRMSLEFPIIRAYKHRNLVLNSALTYMLDKQKELSVCGLLHKHMIFSIESPSEIADALRALKDGGASRSGAMIRRLGAQNRLERSEVNQRRGSESSDPARRDDRVDKAKINNKNTRKSDFGGKDRHQAAKKDLKNRKGNYR